MVWSTPTLAEVRMGLEINGTRPPSFDRALAAPVEVSATTTGHHDAIWRPLHSSLASGAVASSTCVSPHASHSKVYTSGSPPNRSVFRMSRIG